jgi:alpha-N-arabinofuranosidase
MRLLGLLALCPFAAALFAADVVVDVDAARRAAHAIPRTIYGTFLEPIGASIYGGLWAQILENPSLEENLWSAGAVKRMLDEQPSLTRASQLGLPLPWEPLDPQQGARYEPRWGDAANGHRSLLLMGLPGRQSGIRQRVYLPVHRVRRYVGSFFMRYVEGAPDVEVSLRRRTRAGETLARQALRIHAPRWTRADFVLELPEGKAAPLEALDFVIALRGESRILLDQIFLYPADHVERMDPEMIALSKALRTPVVRFGGNFTSAYHWRDGVGDLDKRIGRLNLSWGMPEYNHFGTDEFLAFCRLIGAQPQIALNLGSGAPEEAAEWVRYVNRKLGRTGQLWELGNELWGTFQTGYPTQARAAARTKVFSEAVRRVDPAARLIATGQDPDHFESWNGSLLRDAPRAFDYLATHFVVGAGRVRRAAAPADFVALSAFALPVELERRLRAMKEQIDGTEWAKGKVKIAFTEWLFHGPNDDVPRFRNMGGAVCTAGFLNTLIRTGDFVPISDMTGLIEFGGVWKKRGRVFGAPAYWAFRMYSTADAVTAVESRTTSATYDIKEGNVRLPEIAGVPYLDVVAALDGSGRKLTLFCVNRHLTEQMSVTLRIAGFAPAPQGRAQTLSAPSYKTVNDEEKPEAVVPAVVSFDTARPFPLAPASVAVLEMEKRP